MLQRILVGAVAFMISSVALADTTKKKSDKPLSANEFLRKAAACNVGAIEAAKLAVDRADNPKVKDFAKKMKSEHENWLEEVTKLAKKRNITVEKEPTDECRQKLAKLKSLKGMPFDQEFLSCVVTEHEEAIDCLETQTKTNDEDIKNFAEKALQGMKKHLEEARSLQKTIK